MITNHNNDVYKIIKVHNPLKCEKYYMDRYINPNIVFVRHGRISFGDHIKLQSAPNVSVQRKFCTSVEEVYSDLVDKLFEIELLIGNKAYSTIAVFKGVETHLNPTDVNSLFNIKEEIIDLIFNTLFQSELKVDIDQVVSLREIDDIKYVKYDELTVNKQYLIVNALSSSHVGVFWLSDISEDGVCYFRNYHQMYYKNNRNSLSFQSDLNDTRFAYWEIIQNGIDV